MSVLNRESGPRIPDAAQRARRLLSHVQSSWRQIQALHSSGMSLFWNLPEGITPQDIVNELGNEDAAEIISLSSQLASLIETVDPSAVIPVPENATISIDENTGAVTITTS